MELELTKYLVFVFISSSSIIFMGVQLWEPLNAHYNSNKKEKKVLIKPIYIASEWSLILSEFHGKIIYVLIYLFNKCRYLDHVLSFHVDFKGTILWEPHCSLSTLSWLLSSLCFIGLTPTCGRLDHHGCWHVQSVYIPEEVLCLMYASSLLCAGPWGEWSTCIISVNFLRALISSSIKWAVWHHFLPV